MFHAAICEDEPEISRYIEKTLVSEFEKVGVQVLFEVFHNGNRLLDMIDKHYHFDILFMDIEMPEIDGISICRKIRKVNSETLVVFISNKEELVFSSFEVQPFRFIRKSHYDSLLPSLVTSIQAEMTRRHPNIVQIKEPGSKDLFSFDISQIIYVEALGKNCRIVTTTGQTTIKTKLMEIETQLTEYDFLKPHRSYLVNYKYISTVRKSDLELTDHSVVPISRGHVDEIKKNFLKYTTRGM